VAREISKEDAMALLGTIFGVALGFLIVFILKKMKKQA
jgi:hypothetical protein